MSNWTSGQQLGPYTLIAQIGSGGMGEVWKARDSRLDRLVAVKRLKGDEPVRFQKEARAIASLNHPHICQIYDVGVDHLVMEYIEGKPLRGPLAEAETVLLATQLASALEESHRQGVIHRDLKPGNIMVTREGKVKLLDFGLAKSPKDADLERTGTIEATIMGTTPYMSPEQASGKSLDPRSDIFSLGAVLYEMVSGRRAFDGDSVTEVLTRVIRDEPSPLDASDAFSRIVAKCLAKHPSQRFQTMSELRAELEKIRPQPTTQEPSIAVLPFANMSGDKDNEYFSDGLAEEIINALAHIPGLKVTARTSAFVFRGQEQDIRKIASTLGVKTVLEGSVRRAGNRVRVTAQLIDAEDGYHLWSERYDREMADIFAMQDEIAEAIAAALKMKLAPVRRYTPKLAAYESLLKARHSFARVSLDAFRLGREYCEKAIALDSRYALPHGELATHFMVLATAGAIPVREAMPRIRESARRALEIDPGLPEAHAALGAVSALYDYDWSEAAQRFRQAMATEPVSVTVRLTYAMQFLVPSGLLAEALHHLDRALEEDPLFVPLHYARATCLMLSNRLPEAEAEYRAALELDQNYVPAWIALGGLHTARGDLQKAREACHRAFTLAPWSFFAGPYAGVLMRLGEIDRAQELLKELESAEVHAAPLGYCLYHFVLGELDAAADWLQKAIEQRYPLVPRLMRGQVGMALRNTSRWTELAAMVNLPEVPRL